MIKLSIVIAILIIIVSCGGSRSSSPQEVERDQFNRKIDFFGNLSSRTPVYSYLYSDVEPDSILPENLGAYGYLLLTQRFDDTNYQRYKSMCSAFFRNLESIENYSKSESKYLVTTFWMLSLNYYEEIRTPYGTVYKEIPFESDSCEIKLQKYDYIRAKSMLSTLKMNGKTGPILAAWEHQFNANDTSNNALLIDLSDFSDEDMDRAIRLWIERICADPSLWQDGLNFELFTEQFRSFIQKYGTEIVKYFS